MTEPRAEMPAMRDYGVQESTWQPLPWSWAAERLARSKNLWVVTADGSGRPHAMPVWGVWDDDERRFMFSCSPNARKARNLAANPHVTVAVDDTEEVVSVEGTVATVPGGDRMEWWIARYLDKYRPHAESLSADFIRSHLVVEVTPTKALAVIEREGEFNTRPTRWVF